MLVSAFLEDSAAAHPEKEALVCGDERLTYGDLDDRANRLSHALASLGLRKHERVAIHMGNTAEAVVAIFAVLKAGAVFVLVNQELRSPKVAAILDDSSAAAVITKTSEVLRIAGSADCVRFLLNGGAQKAPNAHGKPCHELRPLMVDRRLKPEQPDDRVGERDTCALIYTSGSTGTPKGVTMSHGNVVAAATSILGYLDIVASDTVLNLLPLSSDYGLYNVLMPIRRGGRVVLDRPYLQPGQLTSPLNNEGVTGLPLTPSIVAMLRRFRHLGIREPGRVRWVTSTGQALPPAHSRWLRTTFPAAQIFSMYGLTECKRVSYLPPEELDSRPTSVGKAIPNTEVRVVDASGGTIDRAGEVGELVVRGPHVMQGYWNRPARTAEVLEIGSGDDDRLLKTGDLFTIDEAGYLYFVGRRDGLIKSGGQLVSPREVEDVVHELEGVCEAAAVGVSDAVLGHALRLTVVLEEEAALTEESIREHCRDHLETFLLPREIEIRPALPRTAAGKVDRRALALEKGEQAS